MTPESAEHLDRAREHLVKARNLLDVMHDNGDAGCAACLAGLHTAQAPISERTGRIAKTQEGVSYRLPERCKAISASKPTC